MPEHRSTIEFRYDPGASDDIVLVINGPRQTDVTSMPRTVSDLSADGRRYVYQTSARKLRRWNLQGLLLTEGQYQELEDFFHNVAIGPTNRFTYIHTDGTSYSNVRFADNQLQARRVSSFQHDVSLALEMEHQVE